MEQYVVKFWKLEGEYWQQEEEIFHAKGKAAHKKVEKLFNSKYRKDVKFISCTYQ